MSSVCCVKSLPVYGLLCQEFACLWFVVSRVCMSRIVIVQFLTKDVQSNESVPTYIL